MLARILGINLHFVDRDVLPLREVGKVVAVDDYAQIVGPIDEHAKENSGYRLTDSSILNICAYRCEENGFEHRCIPERNGRTDHCLSEPSICETTVQRTQY